MIILITFVPLALVVFDQAMYSVRENAGLVQPVLVISKSLFRETTVQVTTTNGTATGEYCSIWINY